jgi:hypothetical protein
VYNWVTTDCCCVSAVCSTTSYNQMLFQQFLYGAVICVCANAVNVEVTSIVDSEELYIAVMHCHLGSWGCVDCVHCPTSKHTRPCIYE